jgi:glycosyltransferase involved in cell wall biosynthesis
MRVCIVGKYPPIEGGVSCLVRQTCWDLHRAGHDVHVVTNADEIEPGLRMLSPRGSSEPDPWPVSSTRAYSPRNQIPSSPAYASRLFGLGRAAVEKVRPDFLVGWYLEPYGVVAAQLAKAFDLPLVLIHAGSDIGFLARVDHDLAQSFRWAVEQADAVVTSGHPESREQLTMLGVKAEQLLPLPGGHPLEDRFRRAPHKIDVAELVRFAPRSHDRNRRPPDAGAPIIGSYGKVGESKGSYDLIESLDRLARRGIPFTFLNSAAGAPERLSAYHRALAEHPRLAERTWVLPPLAPDLIPDFIRACSVVTFLERKFTVKNHTPHVPREVMASGSCLVVSAEVAQQPFYRNMIFPGITALVVRDPRDTAELAATLEQALTVPGLARTFARLGKVASDEVDRAIDRTGLTNPMFRALEQFWEERAP